MYYKPQTHAECQARWRRDRVCHKNLLKPGAGLELGGIPSGCWTPLFLATPDLHLLHSSFVLGLAWGGLCGFRVTRSLAWQTLLGGLQLEMWHWQKYPAAPASMRSLFPAPQVEPSQGATAPDDGGLHGLGHPPNVLAERREQGREIGPEQQR